MNRLCLGRSIRSAMGVSLSGVLAGTVAATILANSATWTAALAQQAPINQQRDEAPIGNQQPRIQDLSPNVLQDEKKMEPELALLWQILSGAGFPNQFFNDSWVVGFWRADHGRQDAGLERRAWTLAQAVSGSVGS